MTSRTLVALVLCFALCHLSPLRAQSAQPAPAGNVSAEVAALEAKAAEGDANAMLNLALGYQVGFGVPHDYAKAAAWYKKAADVGNVSAMLSLGLFYEDGRGVPQDYAQAVAWYKKAADLGDRAAMCNLGGLYYNGKGVPQDYTQAAAWYGQAAELGDAAAMFQLGSMYENSHGVPQNYIQAHMWFNLAASRVGDERQKQYADARENIAEKMTPQQIAEARRLAREWKPKPQTP